MNQNDQQFLVRKIRTQYTEKEHTRLEGLKQLDAKVKRPAHVFAYSFGTLSALVMGSGMSLVMTDLGSVIGLEDPMLPGILIGTAGLLMALINYPVYKKILEGRRKKYAEQILRLSDALLAESGRE